MLGKAALDLKYGLGVVTFCALALGFAAPALAVEKDLTDKGKVLVEQNCGRCHATGKEGAIIDYLESIQDVPSAPPGEGPAEAPPEAPPEAE
jgi:hypothetical protein